MAIVDKNRLFLDDWARADWVEEHLVATTLPREEVERRGGGLSTPVGVSQKEIDCAALELKRRRALEA